MGTGRFLAMVWLVVMVMVVMVVDSASGVEGDYVWPITPAGRQAFDQYGFSVDIENGWVIASARYDDEPESRSGAVFVIDFRTRELVQKLTPFSSGEGEGFFFGSSVSADGELVLVGATQGGHIPPGAGLGEFGIGKAYLMDVPTGEVVQEFHPDDGAFNDRFGSSVSLSGNRALIGSDLGGSYLYDITTGEELFQFPGGGPVALEGDHLMIGGTQYDARTGLMVRSFGSADAVDIDGDLVALGSGFGGAVYNLASGAFVSGFTTESDPNGQNGINSISIDQGRVLTGSWLDDLEDPFVSDAGSASLFDANTGELLSFIPNPHPAQDDEFGISVALDDGYAFVGTWTDGGTDAGNAFLFEAGLAPLGDFNGDGEVGSGDFSLWAAGYGKVGREASAGGADANDDDVIDAADYTLWRKRFSEASGGPLSVPEPAGLATLVGLAIVRMVSRRRRG